jgi:hypothetical protein
MKKVIRSIAIGAAFLVVAALGTVASASKGTLVSPATSATTESLVHSHSLELTSSTESTDENSGDDQGENSDDQGEDSQDSTETDVSSDDQGENSDDQGDNNDDQGDNNDDQGDNNDDQGDNGSGAGDQTQAH